VPLAAGATLLGLLELVVADDVVAHATGFAAGLVLGASLNGGTPDLNLACPVRTDTKLASLRRVSRRGPPDETLPAILRSGPSRAATAEDGGGGLIVFYSALAYAFDLRRPAVREVLAKQIYSPRCSAGRGSGDVVPGRIPVCPAVGQNRAGGGDASTRMLIQTVVMELSPLICGVIVLSRSGAAITSEIAE